MLNRAAPPFPVCAAAPSPTARQARHSCLAPDIAPLPSAALLVLSLLLSAVPGPAAISATLQISLLSASGARGEAKGEPGSGSACMARVKAAHRVKSS